MRSPVPSSTDAYARSRHFVIYLGVVVSIVMLLFPPFSSLNGTEYAFILNGPAWAAGMQDVAAQLGLTTQILWPMLLVQLGALWAVALGAVWFLRQADSSKSGLGNAFMLCCLSLLIVALGFTGTVQAHPGAGPLADTTVGMQGELPSTASLPHPSDSASAVR